MANIKWLLYYLRIGFLFTICAPFIYKNWIYFLISGFSKKQRILYLRNGLKFKLRPKNAGRFNISEIFILKPYLKDRFRISSDDIIIDIGAYIGAFTVYAANIAKKGIVYSFEPIKELFNLLNENIKINNFQNVMAFNKAVWYYDGIKKIYENGDASSFLYSKNKQNYQLVKTTTLETLFTKYNIKIVNFLKMDCEGAEFDILLNAKENVLNKIQKIALEYHNLSADKNVKNLKEYLEKKRFSIKTSKKGWSGFLFAKNREFNI